MGRRTLGIVALCFGLGCSITGGEENRVRPPSPPRMECVALEQQLRACSLITEGAVPCEGEGEISACRFDCTQGATCTELEELICEGIDDDRPSQGRLAECFIQCATQPFRCDSGEETFPGADCDGFAACADGSDEARCAGFGFACASGEVVPASVRCNRFVNCEDGSSDEENCPPEPDEAQPICNGMVLRH